MIVESQKSGQVRTWKFLLECDTCHNKRWVSDPSCENRDKHPCKRCRSKTNWHASNEKRKATCVERYGSTNAFQSPTTKKTIKERYGVENVFQTDDVKKKIKQTLVSNLGVEYPLQSAEVREKFKSTMMHRYGVEAALQSDDIKSRMDFKDAWRKRHASAKRDGTYGTRVSKLELEFFLYLIEQFGVDNVQHQVMVNDWSIDFHVTSFNAYVQFDGVYWHGIKVSSDDVSKRAKSIATTREKDVEQDRWFAEHNLKLVRITDEEFKHGKHREKLAAHCVH